MMRWGFVALVVLGAGETLAASGESIRCTGRVLDPNGMMVAGLEVTLFRLTWSPDGPDYRVEKTASSTSGTDGSFSFTSQRPDAADCGRAILLVDKAGSGYGWATWNLQNDASAEIRLSPPTGLGGRIVDEAGRPVEGATVRVLGMAVPDGPRCHVAVGDVVEDRLATHSGTDGTFRFDRLPQDSTVDLLVEKEGFARLSTHQPSLVESNSRLTYHAGRSDIVIVLPVEAGLEGVVVEQASHRPVAGVKLVIEPEGGWYLGTQAFLGPETIVSSAEGRIIARGLLAGQYTLTLAASPHKLAEWAMSTMQVDLKAGQTLKDVHVGLSKGGILEIGVLSDQDGHGIDAAAVSIEEVATGCSWRPRTDGHGVLRTRLAPGQYEIGLIWHPLDVCQRPSTLVQVEEGKTARQEYRLKPAPSVHGIVRDPQGRPVAGVTISVLPASGTATSGQDGRFEVRWDPGQFDERTDFYVVAADSRRGLATSCKLPSPVTDMDLQLQPSVFVTGVVQDTQGRPMPEATIRHLIRVGRFGTNLPGIEERVGPDGRFELKGLPPSHSHVVVAWCHGWSYSEKDITADEAETGAKVDLGTCVCRKADLAVSGVVVDVNDRPVENAMVIGFGDGQPYDPSQTQTDAHGRFVFGPVCEGPIHLQSSTRTPPRLFGEVRTEGGATDVKFVIAEQSVTNPFVPRKLPVLVGRPLPDLKDLGVQVADANGRPTLVCLVDVDQRPSRRCLADLAKKADALSAKGVTVIVIQTAKTDVKQYEDWLKTNAVAFAIHNLEGDFQTKQMEWGVKALPWLILTDKEHKVVAEGFQISELDNVLNR